LNYFTWQLAGKKEKGGCKDETGKETQQSQRHIISNRIKIIITKSTGLSS
jgi:hypothetical protein